MSDIIKEKVSVRLSLYKTSFVYGKMRCLGGCRKKMPLIHRVIQSRLGSVDLRHSWGGALLKCHNVSCLLEL